MPKKGEKIGKSHWWDTPIENRPQCPICERPRHGNQRRIYPVQYLGNLCYVCWKRTKKPSFYLAKILEAHGLDFQFTPDQINTFIRKVITSRRFPYVVGHHTLTDEYFQRPEFAFLFQLPD